MIYGIIEIYYLQGGGQNDRSIISIGEIARFFVHCNNLIYSENAYGFAAGIFCCKGDTTKRFCILRTREIL